MERDFEERLRQAVQRGVHRAAEKQQEAEKQQLSQDELKTLHGKYRLELCEHIEKCVARLPRHFPGFQVESTFGERGWGAACSRDDFDASGSAGRRSVYSRLEISVPAFSAYGVLELTAKGTIRNREVINRTHFKPLDEVEIERFLELVDAWIIDYAELYAAKSA